MDKLYTLETLITSWNQTFENHELTVEVMKKPHAMMRVLFKVFERMGIDPDVITSAPPEEERNENMYLYWDLIPLINTIRVVNHLILLPQYTHNITVALLLQPTVNTSHSMLLLLYNLIVFREERMIHISAYEEELFSRIDKVKDMKDKKNSLMELLNNQFADKAERAGRLKNIDREMKQYEEELKQEKEAVDKDKQELDGIQKEYRHLDMLIEQKKGQRDALVMEVNKKRELRVYDANDIKAQVEQASQNVQDAEEKLNTLRTTLMQKENSLKNLQSIKPNLDIANNLLYEIMKLSDSLRDCENGDAESKEGEQEDLNAELSELEAQFAELSTARAEAARKRQEASGKRQQEKAKAQSHLREAEEIDKKCAEKSKRAAQKVVELQQLSEQYEKEKVDSLEKLSEIKENFINELKSIDDAVLKKVVDAKDKIEAKIGKRQG